MTKLYHVDGLNHSDNMLIAYLPKEKILVNADLYTPPAQGASPSTNVSPNAVALFRNIKRLKLDVAQHVPIHGSPGGNADFERIVGPVAARAPQRVAGAEDELQCGVNGRAKRREGFARAQGRPDSREANGAPSLPSINGV
jgi:hypothetical protein